MPPLSRRFLGTAALSLIAGIALGFVMLLQREFGGRWPGPLAVSAHTHLILVGGVIEAIFGTAVWLFPRPARGQRQTPAWFGEMAWAALTAGTVIRAVAELLRGGQISPLDHWLIVVGGSLQLVGIVAGVIVLQPRVRASIARTATT